MKVIKNAKILLKDKILEKHLILFDEKILQIKPEKELNLENIECIDAKGNYLASGLIDLHIHGCSGFDTMDANEKSLQEISYSVAKSGVTSFLPTTMTMSKEKILDSLKNIENLMGKKLKGAKILGAHMEGPFISKTFKGAQSEEFIIKPDFEFVKDYLDVIKLITFAPEEDEDFKFTREIVKHKNIILSMGHTNATFEKAIEAIEEGVNYATHTFNAMSGLHHRNPGVVGAIFSKDIYCELIADKIHVHKGFFQGFIDINKKDKVILVTDCMMAGDMPKGEYSLGGQKVIVDQNSARLEDNTLAGSILRLNNGLKNIKENTNLEIFDIINLASLNQATALGMQDKFGSIEIGKYADLIIIDEEFDVKMTFVDGNLIFSKN